MLPEKKLEHEMALTVVRALKDRQGDELVRLVALFMEKYDMKASMTNINKIPKL